MEKMEKNMENDMEAVVFYGCMGLKVTSRVKDTPEAGSQ